MTWDSVARRFDVSRCGGCQRGDHHKGWAARNTVHWADRRLTRPGLRQFLMLIAELRLLNFNDLPEWEQIYIRNTWATRAARVLHRRIPAGYSDNDKARVRYLVEKNHITPTEQAKRWLRIR